MTISTGPDDSLPEFRPRRPPPDYRSWEVRSKLFMLVGLLALALFMMRQARDPDNYRWLIPEDQRAAQADPASGAIHDITSSVFVRDSDPKKSTGEPAIPASTQGSADGKPAPTKIDELSSTGHSEWAREFWQDILMMLDGEEQKLLFRLVTIQKKPWSPDSVDQLSCDLLIEKLDRLIAKKMAARLDSASRLADARADEKTVVADGMLAVRQNWDDQIKPAIRSRVNSEQLADDQNRCLKAFFVDIRNDMLEQVQDLTEVARPTDALAWLLCWNSVLESGTSADPTKVTVFDLMTQPKRYRGQTVQFSGSLRGIDTVKVANQELNLDKYYVLWIQPKELDRTPYCVYATELPKEIVRSTTGFQNERRPIDVVGLFFKVRTYVDTESKISECPLLLARSVTAIEVQLAVVASTSWEPPAWLIYVLLGLIPLVASLVAFLVYRGTLGMRPPSSQGRSNSLRESFVMLSKDSEIVGDKQRIAELEQRHGSP